MTTIDEVIAMGEKAASGHWTEKHFPPLFEDHVKRYCAAACNVAPTLARDRKRLAEILLKWIKYNEKEIAAGDDIEIPLTADEAREIVKLLSAEVGDE